MTTSNTSASPTSPTSPGGQVRDGDFRLVVMNGVAPSTPSTPSTPPVAPASSVSHRLRRTAVEHPVTTYLLLSFGLAWPVMFPAVQAGLPVPLYLPAVALVAQLGPTVLLAALTGGRAGVRELLGRIFRWRVHPGWYAVAVLLLPTVTVLGSSLASGTGPLRAIVDHPSVLTAYLAGFAVVPLVNLWEETGWTGAVQAPLAERHGTLAGAFLTAPLFALIHLPLVVDQPPLGVLAAGAVLVGLAIPFRILIGWLYARTGSSLLLVAVLHAGFNAVDSSGLVDDGTVPGVAPFVLKAVATLLVAIAIVWTTRGRLGGAPGPRGDQGRAADPARSAATGS